MKMNNRGQAFSVFELMIAAIVAVAIIGILFMVLGQVGTGGSKFAQDEIGSVLSQVNTPGVKSTNNFVIDKDNGINGLNLANKASKDSDSIILVVSSTQLASKITCTVEGTTGSSYMVCKSSSSSAINASAQVMCNTDLTALDADIKLTSYDSVEVTDTTYSDMCIDKECCAVIIKNKK
ncbi:MAG: hypothetical protein PHQ98_02595 [Candidatus ainarchaeum sp.]|nr:hypothetical protein [Candidatus ainarchaeum sp.]